MDYHFSTGAGAGAIAQSGTQLPFYTQKTLMSKSWSRTREPVMSVGRTFTVPKSVETQSSSEQVPTQAKHLLQLRHQPQWKRCGLDGAAQESYTGWLSSGSCVEREWKYVNDKR